MTSIDGVTNLGRARIEANSWGTTGPRAKSAWAPWMDGRIDGGNSKREREGERGASWVVQNIVHNTIHAASSYWWPLADDDDLCPLAQNLVAESRPPKDRFEFGALGQTLAPSGGGGRTYSQPNPFILSLSLILPVPSSSLSYHDYYYQ